MIRGALDKLRRGLQKTRDDLFGKLGALLGGRAKLDADTLDVILQFSDSLRAAEGLPAHPDVH